MRAMAAQQPRIVERQDRRERVRETREFTQIEISPVEVVTMKNVDGLGGQVEQRPRGRKRKVLPTELARDRA